VLRGARLFFYASQPKRFETGRDNPPMGNIALEFVDKIGLSLFLLMHAFCKHQQNKTKFNRYACDTERSNDKSPEFKLISPDKSYVMAAPDAAMAQQWVEALDVARTQAVSVREIKQTEDSSSVVWQHKKGYLEKHGGGFSAQWSRTWVVMKVNLRLAESSSFWCDLNARIARRVVYCIRLKKKVNDSATKFRCTSVCWTSTSHTNIMALRFQ
jgi:hypothetical protein